MQVLFKHPRPEVLRLDIPIPATLGPGADFMFPVGRISPIGPTDQVAFEPCARLGRFFAQRRPRNRHLDRPVIVGPARGGLVLSFPR